MSSLKALLAKGVQSAFNATGDLVRTATYLSMTGGASGNADAYDIETGTAVNAGITIPLGQVVFAAFSSRETDKDPTLLTDQRLLFPRAKLIDPGTGLAVDPAGGDNVTDSASTQWQVIQVISDPASVLCTLRVRSPNGVPTP